MENSKTESMYTASEDVLTEFYNLRKLLENRNANFLYAEKTLNGPNLYLMGLCEFFGMFGKKDKKAAREHFELAWRYGHLPSRVILWRTQEGTCRKLKVLLSSPRSMLQLILIGGKYPRDIRILH